MPLICILTSVRILLFTLKNIILMEYTVDYFINFFEVIPEHMWCAGSFLDLRGRSCGNGHLGVRLKDNSVSFAMTEASLAITPIFNALRVTDDGFHEFRDHLIGYSDKLAHINNGQTHEYQQATPKQRVLAALRDVKAMQLKEADKLIEKSLMAEEPNLQLAIQ